MSRYVESDPHIVIMRAAVAQYEAITAKYGEGYRGESAPNVGRASAVISGCTVVCIASGIYSNAAQRAVMRVTWTINGKRASQSAVDALARSKA